MRHMTTIACFAALQLIAASAWADDTIIKTDTAVLDQLAATARDGAALDRPSLERAASAAPIVIEEEVFEEQRLPQHVVQRVVAEHLDEVHACYERLSLRGKAPTGDIGLAFVVEPKGHVTGVVVS